MPIWGSRNDDNRTESTRHQGRDSNSGWTGRRRDDRDDSDTSRSGYTDYDVDVRGGVAPTGRNEPSRNDPSW